MNINEVITAIRGQVHARQSDKPIPRTTQVVVRFLDEEFPIDCIQVETFPGNENETSRTVLAIRIEPNE